MKGEGDVGQQKLRVRRIISIVICLVAAPVLAIRHCPAPLRNRNIEESLENPQEVSSIGLSSLHLSDGRVWEIPGAPLSEVGQEALRKMVARGVEIDEDNNAYGLLKIHHWCGNDSVRDHLARIELGRLLEYVEATQEFRYSEWGWNVSDYYDCFKFFDERDPGDLEQGE